MSNKYIHGFSQSERDRLTKMQTILNERQLDAMDFRGVSCLLDMGSGLGQLTRAMARRLPPGSTVIGIEYNQVQKDEACRQAVADGEQDLVEFRLGDAYAPPLTASEWGSFDLVHARFVLEHVTEPLKVVHQMVEAVRVGGQIYLIDDDHELLRLHPACPPLESLWEKYWHSYRDWGFDPLVGRRLAGLLTAAGARVAKTDSLFYGSSRCQEMFDPVVDNLLRVMESAADDMIAKQHVTAEQFAEAMAGAEAWRHQAEASVWYSLPIAIGIRQDGHL